VYPLERYTSHNYDATVTILTDLRTAVISRAAVAQTLLATRSLPLQRFWGALGLSPELYNTMTLSNF
jgi:hypothetical protein